MPDIYEITETIATTNDHWRCYVDAYRWFLLGGLELFIKGGWFATY